MSADRSTPRGHPVAAQLRLPVPSRDRVPSGRGAVNSFFEFSLLGLVTSGYLAVAGSGYLDLPPRF
jgi:hypothetical protein